ncbi:MAG: hypothetical protein CMM37_13225 [Rhodospirillaceae bacterium]|nr:hypothetical protein [Rhodospirillaceae bacterium]
MIKNKKILSPHFLTVFIVFIGSLYLAEALNAAASPWWSTKQGAVRLLSNTNSVANSQDLRLGLHFKMKPGWKIYWRSPGDAGYPPRIDWSGSQNLKEVKMNWPAPTRFRVLGMETLGYKNEVVFPLDLKSSDAKRSILIKAKVNYLTCNKICIPYVANLRLNLLPGPANSSKEESLINKFQERVPKSPSARNASDTSVLLFGPPGNQSLRVETKILGLPSLIVEGPPRVQFGRPKLIEREPSGKAIFHVRIISPFNGKENKKFNNLNGKQVTLTFIGDINGPIEQKIPINGSRIVSKPTNTFYWTIFNMAALALLGGIILNLMPCVLPVISLKMLSVIKYNSNELNYIRKGFLASASGILCSFLLLASTLVILRAFGQTVGWGIQFQEPIFLGAMAVVMTLFAANLWGIFEIKLPSFLFSRLGPAKQRQSMVENFITGVFATILATPCSAPFLGTAVGFALARGPLEIYVIFVFLGIGFSIPYLIIAIFPKLAHYFPKPGQWMIILRKVLGLALIATVVWLIYILNIQTGFQAALFKSILLFIIIGLLILQKRRSNITGKMIVGIISVAAFLVVINPLEIDGNRKKPQSVVEKFWKKFNPDNILPKVAEGKIVLIDITADWCLTCKVNKVLVLDSEIIRNYVNRNKVIAMRADWTNSDPLITAFLKRFLRYGIPFNIVFGPKVPQGIILPELLTKNTVLSALKKAKKH